MSIEDSGSRREFSTGAVRDIQEGKGRMDLLPLKVIAALFPPIHQNFFYSMDDFITTGCTDYLYSATVEAIKNIYKCDTPTAMLEVSIHFEEGTKKYGERNWEKGIPLQAYVDSSLRHYVKWIRGDINERHDRAVIWNLICGLSTCYTHRELNIYLKEKINDSNKTTSRNY